MDDETIKDLLKWEHPYVSEDTPFSETERLAMLSLPKQSCRAPYINQTLFLFLI
jgi:hypothetical protein